MSVHQLTPDARTSVTVAIVGAGQAGMSASYHLCRAGIDHVVLERHKRFHSWKTDRWDTFCLVTPNWQCKLPDWPYRGDDPEGFMLKNQIIDYVEGFADSFDAPLREGVTVTRVERGPEGRFQVDTDHGLWSADHVIVASGGYDRPITPPFAAALSPAIRQIHSKSYRRPSDIPDGTCLVVGTGQSGVQLMEDLRIAGRDVRLAVGPAPRSPRWYRGKDATDWLHQLKYYDMTIDQQPDPRSTEAKTNHYMSGRDGGHEIDLRRFAKDGLRLYGSVAGMQGNTIRFLPDLEANLDAADQSYVGIRTMIDDHIARQGIEAPVEAPFEKVWRPETETTEIDAAAEGITSILWCIGFRPDYSWLRVSCLDERGRPIHTRGVCDEAGVYFLGLGWLHTWGSGRFLGVADDAAYVADKIAHRVGGEMSQPHCA
ncbi:MSMEG_0569 family flavin-dependent oxidoreductase [Puniceibacterium sp. IMCC21224]|uniref:MSMEG_0569 family flavin-dependent oxidoreductase n=1 Tax=Puniceibacterium sp. IMCC21224 TaxID=1618204 RepID=UPI00064E03E1|nr:MSMEG_0569 family flavin-dependent oxidoreductase [Puniceibacterium sp. IMCC21224]KMK66689.1 flavin-dependent oxidoreductase, MSMEG_0569 family [Puniceibacterium sp. IMCC21224]